MNNEQNYAFKRIEMSGYKSIQDVVVEDISPLMVLAGSNGAGKSNFVDALKTLSELLTQNIEVFTEKLDDELNISIQVSQSENIIYGITVSENKITNEFFKIKDNKFLFKSDDFNKISGFEFILSKIKNIEEEMSILNKDIKDNDIEIEKRKNRLNELNEINANAENANYLRDEFSKLSSEVSYWSDIQINLYNTLMEKITELSNLKNGMGAFSNLSLIHPYQNEIKTDENLSAFIEIISNIQVFRIDPIQAKKPSIDNSTTLKSDGSNIASVLVNLETDDELRETILDWLSLIVPEMQHIKTDNRPIDGSKMLEFTEESGKKFPAHLVSDGTIYALCMLVAILTRTKKAGITIIEEPERGLHPKAIGELIGFMREYASISHPIILTTHSESVVRELELNELFFVSKENGKTKIKSVKDSGVDKREIPLDTAWLTNMLNGGLPW